MATRACGTDNICAEETAFVPLSFAIGPRATPYSISSDPERTWRWLPMFPMRPPSDWISTEPSYSTEADSLHTILHLGEDGSRRFINSELFSHLESDGESDGECNDVTFEVFSQLTFAYDAPRATTDALPTLAKHGWPFWEKRHYPPVILPLVRTLPCENTPVRFICTLTKPD